MLEARCCDCHVKIELADKDIVKCGSCGMTMRVVPGTPPTLMPLAGPKIGPLDNDTEKPTDVSIAVALLYVSFGIGFLAGFVVTGPGGRQTSDVVISVVILLPSLLLTVMISQGRNWARKVFLVLFFVSLPFFLMALAVVSGLNPLAGIAAASPAALQGISATLLLKRTSKAWFVSQSRPVGSIV